jgi:hypothetical protein
VGAVITAAITVAGTVVSHGAPRAESAAERVVLGSAEFIPNGGDGWGKVRPRRIDNGGVPSGIVERIRWARWGKATARGYGRTWLYRPEGGYYRQEGRIQLRAFRVGTCPGDGVRAYTRLRARVQVRPGGRYGRWQGWTTTSGNICSL